MRLKSISYCENEGTPREWRLDKMSYYDRMLIVGKNTAGKSRSLRVVSSLANLLIGAVRNFASASYLAAFDKNGKEYIYEITFRNSKVVHERIAIDGKDQLVRHEGGSGKIRADQLDIEMEFEVVPDILSAVVKRDKKQHPFIEPLFEWASSLRHYELTTINQGGLIVFGPIAQPVNEKDQNAVAAIFNEGKKLYGERFVNSIIKDLSDVEYNVDSIKLSPPVTLMNPPPELFAVAVKEKDLPDITDQLGMSTGMFRVLAILIHVNFASFKGHSSSVLIDDIGEGLDFDRSCRLINLLRSKSKEYGFQLVMTTNDKFVMNNVPLDEWTVLHRSKNTVHVRNHENSSSAFEDFKFTGLSNFSFFEINAVEMDSEGNITH